LTYKEQRELAMLPTQIEALEAEQVTLHTRLEDADLFQRDPTTFDAIMQRLTAMQAEVDTAYARWEELERRQAQS
jgi:ATP-binding cassette subfamily F protein uup